MERVEQNNLYVHMYVVKLIGILTVMEFFYVQCTSCTDIREGVNEYVCELIFFSSSSILMLLVLLLFGMLYTHEDICTVGIRINLDIEIDIAVL